MDKIAKFLKYLSKKERGVLKKILSDILLLNVATYDVKKLKGHQNLFRLRHGKLRIIYFKDNLKGIIVNIGYRGKIYKELD